MAIGREAYVHSGYHWVIPTMGTYLYICFPKSRSMPFWILSVLSHHCYRSAPVARTALATFAEPRTLADFLSFSCSLIRTARFSISWLIMVYCSLIQYYIAFITADLPCFQKGVVNGNSSRLIQKGFGRVCGGCGSTVPGHTASGVCPHRAPALWREKQGSNGSLAEYGVIWMIHVTVYLVHSTCILHIKTYIYIYIYIYIWR